MQSKFRMLAAALIIAMAASPLHAAEPDLKGAAELIKAGTDYKRFVTEAKKAEAEIHLKEAEAAAKIAEADQKYADAEYLRTKAAHLRAFTMMMTDEFYRIRNEEAENKYRIYVVRQHAELCSGLADGITHRGGFQCMDYFRKYMVSFSLQKKMLFDDKLEALPVDEFVANYSAVPVIPFPGGNVGQLLKFAEANDLSFTPFGKAHSHVINFLDAIANAAQAKIQEYQNYIDGVRAGRLDVFKLPEK